MGAQVKELWESIRASTRLWKDYVAALQDWCAASGGAREGLIADVHKFAGSAGFARRSAVVTLIEISLPALPEGVPDRRDVGQIACFCADFAEEVAALAPTCSSLLSG